MTCPQCHKHIPAKAVWTTSGFSGVVCPECHASLCPTPISAIIVFALSFGLGDAALMLLRHRGADLLVSFAGFFVVFAVVFALAAPCDFKDAVEGSYGAASLGNRAWNPPGFFAALKIQFAGTSGAEAPFVWLL